MSSAAESTLTNGTGLGTRSGVRRVPHYAMRTVAHSAPEYALAEQDLIRQSFSAGNHTWMKQALPVELGPDSVNMLRRQRMERNRLAEPPLPPQTWSKMVGGLSSSGGCGGQGEFEYMPEEYDRNSNERRRAERLAQRAKREKIANHDWRYSSREVKLKHEPLIKDSRRKETYPYLGGDQDAELPSGKHFLRMQLPLTSWKKEKHTPSVGSFLAGKSRDWEASHHDSFANRLSMPSIVQQLQKRLSEDWEGTTVMVSVTDQDLVQIAFDMATVDSERGVMAYMNVLSKDADLLGTLGLRKVSQLWGMKREFSTNENVKVTTEESGGQVVEEDEDAGNRSWVFFLLCPKWVRMRPTDAYYTVHPPARGAAFRMSSAGSSVLISLGTSVVDPEDLTRRNAQQSSASGPQSARESSARRKNPHDSKQSIPMSARASPDASTERIDLAALEQAVQGLPQASSRPGVTFQHPTNSQQQQEYHSPLKS